MESEPTANTVIATYRVRGDALGAFLALLREHHPTLVRLGLATPEPAVVYRGDEGGAPVVYEIFTWVDANAPEVAHETPEVMRIWEALGTLVEERDGRPQWAFPHVVRVDLAAHG